MYNPEKEQARTARMRREQQERSDRLRRQQQERTEKILAEQRARTERILAEQRERTERQQKAYREQIRRQQENSQRLIAEQRARTERILAEQRERSQRLREAAEKREGAFQETRFFYEEPFTKGRGKRFFGRFFKSKTPPQAEYDFGFDYEELYKILFNMTNIDEQTKNTNVQTEELSRSEITRRRLMSTLPVDSLKTLSTYEDSDIRGVIGTVYLAREANAERTDWDIYLSYRRSIETENPDQGLVVRTQIAGLLLEGTRKEARFPF